MGRPREGEREDELGIRWRDNPVRLLRPLRNGTLFLLRRPSGTIEVYALFGNLATDVSVKAQSLYDRKVIRVENIRGAMACVIVQKTLRQKPLRRWADKV